jgi:hypothetical protein
LVLESQETALNMAVQEVLSALVSEDGIACGPDLMRIIGRSTPEADRRRRVRLPLSWKIYLLRASDTHPLETRTRNLSSEGFYCLVPEPFVVSECVRCTIFVPVMESVTDVEHDRDFLMLECGATVLRIENLGLKSYGIGCRIDNYRISSPTKMHSGAQRGLHVGQ